MIIVNAGPDDWAFERDRYYWRMWIKYNITPTGFEVNAHATDSFKAIVTFKEPQCELMFALKAPEYITAPLVPYKDEWVLGATGP